MSKAQVERAPATEAPAPSAEMVALAQAVRERRAILFAGAGLSMSIGLPSWDQLIAHMREELGLAADEGASYQTLAEYYRLKIGSIGPLRSWMDRQWSVSDDAVRRSKAHQLIVELDFPIIYTTNYDANLEAAYRAHGRDFVKIANARDIAKASDATTQIVKFHGDFEDDQSLVLAETDYFDRLGFTSPLDVKFRADALGRTLLFVGYSMSDLNIRLLLHRLWQTWRESGYQQHRPRSFVFMANTDEVQASVLGQWGVTVLDGQDEEPGQALVKFLTSLKAQVCAA
jgi:hypothetical protein